MAGIDLDRLSSTLNVSPVKTNDNALFQVVSQLITAVRAFQNITNTTISGNSGDIAAIKSRTFLTVVDETVTLPNSKQTNLTGFTAGSVIFSAGDALLAEDNTNFFFDNTNNFLRVPKIVGGTGVNDDLHLQSTTGVGTINSRIFLDVGDNGAIPAVEIRPDDGGNFGRVGIGTAGNIGVAAPLTVFGTGADIGYVIIAKAANGNPSCFTQLTTGANANAQAGFSFFQAQNSIEWLMAVTGNEGNAMRWTVIDNNAPSNTNVFYATLRGNFVINSTSSEPSTGTKGLFFGDGTVPSSLASNTAGLYANDVSGTVQLFAINEAGRSTQLTDVAFGAISSTGTVNDQAISGAEIFYLDNATDLTLTGLVAGFDGQRVTLVSRGAGNVYLPHQTGSSAANQFFNNITSGPTPLAANKGTATYEYDASISRWRLAEHKQGDFIEIPFASCTYDSNTGAFWTVGSGDITTQRFLIVDKTILLHFIILGTTTTAGVGARLRVDFSAFVSYTFTFTMRGWARVVDGGAAQTGMVTCGASGVSLVQFSTNVADTAWGTGAGRNIDAVSITVGIT